MQKYMRVEWLYEPRDLPAGHTVEEPNEVIPSLSTSNYADLYSTNTSPIVSTAGDLL